MSDDDIDSEDELRLTIAREENLEKSTWPLVNESENDPFEVVRDDFKSDSHKFHTSIGLGLKNNISSLIVKIMLWEMIMTLIQEIRMKSLQGTKMLVRSKTV